MLTMQVDGQTVTLSAQEEADVRAQWAAADAAQATYVSTKQYLDQRNQALATQIGELMTLLYNDISSGISLNAGTFYSAMQTINSTYPQPKATPTT